MRIRYLVLVLVPLLVSCAAKYNVHALDGIPVPANITTEDLQVCRNEGKMAGEGAFPGKEWKRYMLNFWFWPIPEAVWYVERDRLTRKAYQECLEWKGYSRPSHDPIEAQRERLSAH